MRALAERIVLNHFLNAWPQDLSFDEVIELVDEHPEQVTPRLHHSRKSLDAFLMRQMLEELLVDLYDELQPGREDLLKQFSVTRLMGHGTAFISPLFHGFVHTALEHYAKSVISDDGKDWPENFFVTLSHWKQIAKETLEILENPRSVN